MKPYLLTMQAFGPFPGRQEIPFHDLFNHSLFLIHGPTGSGKTTILDAICFALYGETSGNERDATGMRSQYATVSLPTEITFEFLLGNDHYRVLRIPEQERTKVRGDGITKKPSTATLWKLSADGSDGNVLAERWGKVTEKIESILGFKSDQFRQVVMIPQGQFRKFLSANSQERQEILAVLFKTGWFKKIEDTLKEKVKSVKTDFDSLTNQKSYLFRGLQVENRDQIATRLKDLIDSIADLHTKSEILRSEEKAQSDRVNEGKLLEQKFIELQSSKELLVSLDNKKVQIADHSSRLEKAQRAELLRSPWEHLQDNLKEQLLIKKNRDDAFNKVQKSISDLHTAEQQFKTSQEKEHLRDSLLIELEDLRKLQPKISNLEQIRKNCSIKQEFFQNCDKIRNDKKELLQKIKSALQRLQEEGNRLQESAILINQRKQEKANAETALKHIARFNDLNKELKSVSPVVEASYKLFQKIDSDLQKSKDHLSLLEDSRLKGQASILALNLTEGLPCPVCGSLTHPSPAPLSATIPNESDITKFKSEILKLEKSKEETRQQLDNHREKLSLIHKELSMIENFLKELNVTDPDTVPSWYNQCNARLQDSEAAEKRIIKINDDKIRGNEALTKTEQEIISSEENYNASISELSAEKALLSKSESEIPEHLRSSEILSKMINEKTSILNNIVQQIENARKLHEKARESHISAESILLAAEQSVLSCNEKVQTVSNSFCQSREMSGFNDDDSFKSSLLSDHEQKILFKTINDFNLSYHSAEQRFTKAHKDCLNVDRPDILHLQEQLAVFRKELDRNIEQSAFYQKEYEHINKQLTELQSLEERLSLIEKDYKIIGSIAEVASGVNPQRITFERFVLSSLLDDVLYTGSLRLKAMSRNRFELHRARTHSDQRTSGGLELLVFDSWTGTSRPISSLSGGESFLAALSLALGLSDIVQSYAGGLKLDTMFIDEGFGSLDAEALDMAFRALIDIGKGGRLVGIISHVSELKERIDCRLEVLSSSDGSTMRLIR